MGILDNLSPAEMQQIAGLLASLPTLSGRTNPMQPMASYLTQAGEREAAAKRQKQKDDMEEQRHGFAMYESNNNINRQAIQDNRQAAADQRAGEQRSALGNVAQSYNPQSSLYQPPGILAGQDPQAVNQFRTEQGILAGMSPKDFASTPVKQPTSVQEYEYAKGNGFNGSYEQFLKAKQQTTMVKEDQPLNLADIGKLILPSGAPVPFGTTMSQAGQLGARLKEKPVAADSAGKQAMVDTAINQYSDFEKLLYPKGIGGKIDNEVIKGMAIKSMTPDILQPLTGGVSSKGQLAAQSMELMIQGQTRLETGAAMQNSELGNSRKRFQPFPWDDPAVQKQKILAMKLFLNNAKKYFDPNINKQEMTPEQAAKLTQQAIDRALLDASQQLKQTQKPGILNSRPPLSSFVR